MRVAVDIWIKFTKFLFTYLIFRLVFHLQVFSCEATFFCSKTIKSRIGSYMFYLLTNEKIYKWKTGLIGQANGSKVVYLSADPNVGPLTG